MPQTADLLALRRPSRLFLHQNPDTGTGTGSEFGERPVSSSSEESLPFFEDDEDLTQEIETDV